jgi:hypothetical protein
MIHGSGLLNVALELIVGGLIFYVLWWGLGKIAPPEPINKILTVLLVLVIVIWLINILMGFTGHPLFAW